MLSYHHPQSQYTNTSINFEESVSLARAGADDGIVPSATSHTYELESLNTPVPLTNGVTFDDILAPIPDTPSSQKGEHEHLSWKAGGHLPTRSFDKSKLRHNKLDIWLVSIAALLLVTGPALGLMPNVVFGIGSSRRRWYGDNTFSSACDGVDSSSSNSTLLNTFFTIDILLGNMPFGRAKFVDVAFDVVIGRGGQAVLSYIICRVIGASVMYVIEKDPVTYELFARSFTASITIFSLGPFLAFVFRGPKPAYKIKHRILMAWLTLSVLWVGLYPTIMSAMTGYAATKDTWVRLADGSLKDFATFTTVPDITFVLLNHSFISDADANRSISAGNAFTDSGPNITLWKELNNSYVQDAIVHDQNQTYMSCFAIDSFSYPFRYTAYPQNVQCIATNRYQWGFSFNLTITAIVANGLWTIGTYAIWMHLERKSEFHRKRRQVGKYRAAIDMAEAIANELGPHTCAYPEEEIEAELEKRPPIRYQVREDDERDEAHIGLSSDDPKGKRVKLEFGRLYGSSKCD